MYHTFFTHSSVNGHLFSILPSLGPTTQSSTTHTLPLSPYNFVHKVNSLCLIDSCFHYRVFVEKKKNHLNSWITWSGLFSGLHSRKTFLRLSPAPSRSSRNLAWGGHLNISTGPGNSEGRDSDMGSGVLRGCWEILHPAGQNHFPWFHTSLLAFILSLLFYGCMPLLAAGHLKPL